MKWENFKDKFHPSWHAKIRPFIESAECDAIYAELKKLAKEGAQIAPESCNTFRCFQETRLDELTCVILCQDPYSKFIDGKPIASGVAMDCSITARLQPTLRNFYEGIETELYNGLNLDYIDTWDMSYLTKQGVLLLNASLTVEKDKPDSHAHLWATFTMWLLKEVIGPTGVPILFLGKSACSFSKAVEDTNYCLCLPHPASAAYSGGKWNTSGAFKKINDLIYSTNKDTIMWLHIDPPF